MKLFELPKVEILKFSVEDVITTSTEDPPVLLGDCI